MAWTDRFSRKVTICESIECVGSCFDTTLSVASGGWAQIPGRWSPCDPAGQVLANHWDAPNFRSLSQQTKSFNRQPLLWRRPHARRRIPTTRPPSITARHNPYSVGSSPTGGTVFIEVDAVLCFRSAWRARLGVANCHDSRCGLLLAELAISRMQPSWSWNEQSGGTVL